MSRTKNLNSKIKNLKLICVVCCLLPVIFFALARHVHAALSLFPKAGKPPEHLYVINVDGKSYEEKVLAATFEGVINRKEPRLYLIEKDSDDDSANFILSLYKEKYGVASWNITLEEALVEFKNEINGAIVYDPQDNFTVNICTTLAGLKNAVCVTEALLPLTEKAGLKTLQDLRGKWKDKSAAYREMFKTYYPQCSKKALGILSPAEWRTRDYLVQNKIFTFFAKALPKQKPLLEEILSKTPDNIPVFGYLSSTALEELLAVETLSMHNKILVPSDLQSNLSVHSGFAYAPSKFKAKKKERKIPDIKGKLAVVLAFSDGDNVYVPLTYFLQKKYWRSPNRGKIPVGWSISQSLLDIAPAVAAYYKETATENDELVAMISVGYTHPTYYQKIEWLADKTLEYVSAFGLTSLWTIDPTLYNPETSFSQKMLSLFAKPPLSGFLVGYSPATTMQYAYMTKSGFPLLVCQTNYEDNADILKGYIQKELSTLKGRETRVVFYGLSNWGFNLDDVANAIQPFQKDSRIVFLKPSEAFTLLRTSP